MKNVLILTSIAFVVVLLGSNVRADDALSGSVHPFANVAWASKPDQIKHGFKVDGYAFTGADKDGDLDFTGSVLGVPVDIFAYITPAHELVRTEVLCKTPDDQAIDFYHSMQQSLISKYGQPTKSFEFYDDPYSNSDSDSDKQTAIAVGEGHLASFWEYSDTSGLSLEITTSLSVDISYESSRWPAELDRRKSASTSGF